MVGVDIADCRVVPVPVVFPNQNEGAPGPSLAFGDRGQSRSYRRSRAFKLKKLKTLITWVDRKCGKKQFLTRAAAGRRLELYACRSCTLRSPET